MGLSPQCVAFAVDDSAISATAQNHAALVKHPLAQSATALGEDREGLFIQRLRNDVLTFRQHARVVVMVYVPDTEPPCGQSVSIQSIQRHRHDAHR